MHTIFNHLFQMHDAVFYAVFVLLRGKKILVYISKLLIYCVVRYTHHKTKLKRDYVFFGMLVFPTRRGSASDTTCRIKSI